MSVHVNRPLEPKPKAIVVGASSGIGAALVRELAHQGYRVAAVARREEKLAELCRTINTAVSGEQPVARYYVHDVTDYDQAPELLQKITTELGGLDLFVYSAGVMPAVAPNEYNFAKDAAMINVNFLGAVAWLGPVADRFSRAESGQIVGISSLAAVRGRRQNPVYNASKAGFDVYLEALRNRLSQHGVTVTTIRPGFIETEMLKNAPKTFWVISAGDLAGQIYRAIRRKKQVVYLPIRWWLVSLVVRALPSFIFRRLAI